MRKFALLGASALVLALGVASASAEPFNPATDAPGYITGPGYYGNGYGYGNRYGYDSGMNEGRAAAIESDAPFFGVPVPFLGAPTEGSAPGSVVLQQFHEAGSGGHGR